MGWMLGLFILAYFLPIETGVFQESIRSAFSLLKWYAREHVILCLLPAFFIAGTIAVFIAQSTVIKYLGAGAKKWISYSLASISGSILAVCSCTVLPLFTGIYKRGASLGPATAFLYAGPAVNIMAIILTTRILGVELGVARILGAVSFSIIIGLVMQAIFKEPEAAHEMPELAAEEGEPRQSLTRIGFHFLIMVVILIFATWGPGTDDNSLWMWIFSHKWWLTALGGMGLGLSLILLLGVPWTSVGLAVLFTGLVAFLSASPLAGFLSGILALIVILAGRKDEGAVWLWESYSFAKQILPLLAVGVLAAGFLLGAPETGGGLIPGTWISGFVGGNSIGANLFASVIGAFMYFATLTEIPILQGLMNRGMGDGPALALLLAGPALSLPNMLVIRRVLGTRKTMVYILLVVALSTLAGFLFGWISA